MDQKVKKILPVLIIILSSLGLFWQFFIHGFYPFPGNYLLAWHEPWKSNYFSHGTISIPHKPVLDDVFRIDLPFKLLARDLLLSREWPLWNPYNGGGMPLLATIHVGFFNPFNIFFLFLNTQLAWLFYIALQPLLISLWTYLYTKRLGLSSPAALLSSFSFLFSGFVVTRIFYGEFVYILSYLPLLLYIIEQVRENPRTKLLLVVPPLIFFMIGSGQPQMVMYVCILLCFYSLYRLMWQTQGVQKLFLFFSMVLLGIGIASIQLIPTLELFQHASIRTPTSSFIFKQFLLPLSHLISLPIPNYFGNQATYNYWGVGDYVETIAYIGLIPCFFAFLSLAPLKTHRLNVKKFYYVTIAISLALTLQWVGARLFYTLPIPVVSTGVPSRLLSVTTFSLAILAGYGFDTWTKTKTLQKSMLRLALFFTFSLSLLLVSATSLLFLFQSPCIMRKITNCHIVALRNTMLETGVFTVSLILFFAYLIFQKKHTVVRIAPLGILLLVLITGFYNSNKFLPFSSKDTFFPKNDLIQVIQAKTHDARLFGLGEASIKTNFATYLKFYDPNYFNPLYSRRYGELISWANSARPTQILPRSDIEIVSAPHIDTQEHARRERLLNLLSVKYFIFKRSEWVQNTAPPHIIWENDTWYLIQNPSALPRAYFAETFEVKSKSEEILKRLFDPSFNYRTTAVLENTPPFQLSKSAQKATARLKTYEAHRVIVQIQSNSPQLLILTDNFYPGWKAFIDGEKTSIYRANYTLRGVFIPSGKHEVVFLFQPLSLQVGILLSLFSCILYTLLISRFLNISLWPKISSNKYHS